MVCVNELAVIFLNSGATKGWVTESLEVEILR